MRIVVTAGDPWSLHAAALVHQLAARGHEIVLGVCVRPFSIKRIRQYLQHFGWTTLVGQLAGRLSGRTGRSPGRPGDAAMLKYLTERNISSRSVPHACQAIGAKYLSVEALNTAETIQQIRIADPDLIVYAGGGILRDAFLSTARLGVLNPHGGPLPQFRGMHVVYWAMMHGVRPAVTVHFVDQGVDTGPIVLQKPIQCRSWSEVFTRQDLAVSTGVDAVIEAVDAIAQGRVRAVPQHPEEGRQFFFMAPALLEVLQRWVAAGKTPVMDASVFRFSGAEAQRGNHQFGSTAPAQR